MNMESDKEQERIGLRVTAYSQMGNRKYMEDVYSVAYQKREDGSELDFAYFGMFDGHGGDTAALFAKNHLMNFIVDQSGFWSNDDEDVLNAIKTGFIECHMAMWRDLDNWPPTASGLPSTAGTTASVAFIRKGKLYIGHCGDSGIVLGTQNEENKWDAVQLTVDHKPENPEEKSRIEACGGKIIEKAGIHRVVWYRPRIPHQGPIRRNTRIEEIPFLAVGRSLGDLWSYNWKTKQFMVSPEPDVAVYELDSSKNRCLVFASDGLWNIMDGQTAVDLVYEVERSNEENLKYKSQSEFKWINPSRHLVEIALRRWRENRMRSDNTSVVCVMLDEPNKRHGFDSEEEPEQNSRTIYDFSTREAYNLDYIDMDAYNQPSYNLDQNSYPYYQHHYPTTNSNQLPSFSSAGYQAYSHTSYSIEEHHTTANTSSSSSSTVDVTYHTSHDGSGFIRGCCPNERYLLADSSEKIHQHETFNHHKEMYENMAQQKLPPLHYAYQPVINPDFAFKLPGPDDNYARRMEIHIQNFCSPRPTERYNFVRPTEEQLIEIHNEMKNSRDEEEEMSDTDTEEMDWSDEDKAEESASENNVETLVSENNDEIEIAEKSNEHQVPEITNSQDDSIQIFEISSSNLELNEKSSKSKVPPERSNNKENSETPVKKKKTNKSTHVTGRYYETRQTNCKMRSGNIRLSSSPVASSSGIQKTIGKEKNLRKATKAVKKGVKNALQDEKPSTSIAIKKIESSGIVKSQNNNSSTNIKTTENKVTVEKGQNIVQPESRILRSSQASPQVTKKTNVMRNLRSSAASNEKSSPKKKNGKIK